jgi:hypothetical protein
VFPLHLERKWLIQSYMNRIKFAVLALAAFASATLLTGCASIMCGSRQDVTIDSRPRGADALVYNERCEVIFKNTTPCVASLKRQSGDSKKGTYVVVVKKEGYSSTQVPLSARVNSAYYLNIPCGLIGLAIDPITGAMWSFGAEQPDGHDVKDNASFYTHEGLFVNLKETAPKDVATDPKAGEKTKAGHAVSKSDQAAAAIHESLTAIK